MSECIVSIHISSGLLLVMMKDGFHPWNYVALFLLIINLSRQQICCSVINLTEIETPMKFPLGLTSANVWLPIMFLYTKFSICQNLEAHHFLAKDNSWLIFYQLDSLVGLSLSLLHTKRFFLHYKLKTIFNLSLFKFAWRRLKSSKLYPNTQYRINSLHISCCT